MRKISHLWVGNAARARTGVLCYAISLGLLGLVTAANAIFGFAEGVRVLYVLPIWYAIRVGRRVAGTVAVAVTVFTLAMIDLAAHMPPAGIVYATVLRAISFSAVAYFVNRVEAAFLDTSDKALRDPLTGLLNRRALLEFAEEALEDPRPDEQGLAVVMIDCDGFKALNDTYGHRAGDHVLQMLARVLERETRSSDLVARVGGDEFVVVLNSISDEEASQVLQRIEERFEQQVSDAGYPCTISVGVAPLEQDDMSIDELLETADRAMYVRKQDRKVYMN